jgi:hypothetical protein
MCSTVICDALQCLIFVSKAGAHASIRLGFGQRRSSCLDVLFAL